MATTGWANVQLDSTALDDRPRPLIAILLPDLRPGGAERMRVELARHWLAQGIDVEFLLLRASGELLALLPDGARIEELRVSSVFSAILPLIRYLRQRRPDALLAAMWSLTVIAPLAARLANYRGRVVVSEHSAFAHTFSAFGWWRRLAMRTSMRLAYPWASARVAVSDGVADHIAGLSGLARDRFEVIYNPAATGLDHTASPVPAPLTDLPRPVVLAVGTLKRQKRFDLLLTAFALLDQRCTASLCILGEGQERTALEAQVASLGLEGKVILPGFTMDTGPWYANADLFVLSSDYEGFGNVIVEALEQGLPVVSTDCEAGPREILADGRYGRLVTVGDVAGLADAMFDALAEEPERAALKRRAREFSVARAANAYLDLLLPERRSRHSA